MGTICEDLPIKVVSAVNTAPARDALFHHESSPPQRLVIYKSSTFNAL